MLKSFPQLKIGLFVFLLAFENSVFSRCIFFIWLPRWLSGKESAYQCRRHRRLRLDPGVEKILWKRKWQLTPVFLPGKSCRQRSLMCYSPWGRKESDTTELLSMRAKFFIRYTIWKNFLPAHDLSFFHLYSVFWGREILLYFILYSFRRLNLFYLKNYSWFIILY